MGIHSISDLEHLSGIKAHTLRIWEQRYNFIKPKRTDTNIRYYDEEDLKFILNIALLKEHGFKISCIAKMSAEEMNQEVMNLIDDQLNPCEHIQALTIAMMDLNELRFEKIIATYTLKHGFENTMLRLIYPFMMRTGILWQTGGINPAQEHFITNLVRQKIIVAIDGQMISSTRENTRKFMLFLPEGELHEIALLFAHYLLKIRQQLVIYLGQNMPFTDLQEAFKVYQPDYLLTIVTCTPNENAVKGYLEKLAHTFTSTTILAAGAPLTQQDFCFDCKNINILKDIKDFIQLIDCLT